MATQQSSFTALSPSAPAPHPSLFSPIPRNNRLPDLVRLTLAQSRLDPSTPICLQITPVDVQPEPRALEEFRRMVHGKKNPSPKQLAHLRFEQLRTSLQIHQVGFAFSSEEETTMKEIFIDASEFAIRFLPSFFMFSILSDLEKAAATFKSKTETAEKGKFLTEHFIPSLREKWTKLHHRLRLIKILPPLDDIQEEKNTLLTELSSHLDKVQKFIQKSSHELTLIKKILLWKKFVDQKESYCLFEDVIFINDTKQNVEKQQSAENKTLLSESKDEPKPTHILPQTMRVDELEGLLGIISLEEMIGKIIQYIDLVLPGYPPDSAKLSFLKALKMDIQDLASNGTPEKKVALLERLSQSIKKATAETHTIGTQLNERILSFGPLSALASLGPMNSSSPFEQIMSQTISEILRLSECLNQEEFYANDLITIYDSLDLCIRSRFLLIAYRLYGNLKAHFLIEERIQSIPLFCSSNISAEMRRDFITLKMEILHINGTDFSEIGAEILEKPFDRFDIPKQMQTICKQRIPHWSLETAKGKFLLLHKKYSQIATALMEKGNAEEAIQLKEDYLQLCFLLIPIFFCRQDVQNLKREQYADQNTQIIPPEILGCFDIDLNISQDPLPAQLDPPDDASHPLPIAAVSLSPSISFREDPLSPEDPFLYEFKRLGNIRLRVPRPYRSAKPLQQDADPLPVSPPRIVLPRAVKVSELERLIAQQFYVIKEGGRHRRVLDPEGRQVTVLSRGSQKQQFSRRMRSVVQGQLNKPRS